MNDPPDGDVLSLNADSLTLTAECNHVLYKPCIVININKPHLETSTTGGQCWKYNNTGIFNGRGIKYALQFSVHAGRY